MTSKRRIVVGFAVPLGAAAIVAGAGCPERRHGASGQPLPPELRVHYPASRPATRPASPKKTRNAKGMLVDVVQWQSPFDFNVDGCVDGIDYAMFAQCFNGTGNRVASGCGYVFSDTNTMLKLEAGLAPRSFTCTLQMPKGSPYQASGAVVELSIQYRTCVVAGTATITEGNTASGTLVFRQTAQ